MKQLRTSPRFPNRDQNSLVHSILPVQLSRLPASGQLRRKLPITKHGCKKQKKKYIYIYIYTSSVKVNPPEDSTFPDLFYCLTNESRFPTPMLQPHLTWANALDSSLWNLCFQLHRWMRSGSVTLISQSHWHPSH